MITNLITSDERIHKYEVTGTILAETAEGIGVCLSEDDKQRWPNIMGALAIGDDLVEADSKHFDADSLLEHLDLDPDDDDLNIWAGALLRSSTNALGATSLLMHFSEKSVEALSCMNILRFSCDDAYKKHEKQWEQLNRVSIAGQYIDCTRDATEDAAEMTQFEARDLRDFAIKMLIGTAKTINWQTWKSLLRASHRHGLDKHLIFGSGVN